jgi:hypothetical protein
MAERCENVLPLFFLGALLGMDSEVSTEVNLPFQTVYALFSLRSKINERGFLGASVFSHSIL